MCPTLPVWDGWGLEQEEGVAPRQPGSEASSAEASLREDFEQRLDEESRHSFEAGRERGQQEGRQAEQQAQAEARAQAEAQRAGQAAHLIERFAQAQDRYLHAVEHEVVELALAVAARILRREAQMDPLLLTGAVRVALGQLANSTQVRLRVPTDELELWTQAIGLLPNLAVKPTVVAGAEMHLGDCVVETEMGSVDLGIRAQLGEIERWLLRSRRRAARQPIRRPGRWIGSGLRSSPVRARRSRAMTPLLTRYFSQLNRGIPGGGADRCSSPWGRPSNRPARWRPWASVARFWTSSVIRIWPRSSAFAAPMCCPCRSRPPRASASAIRWRPSVSIPRLKWVRR